MRYSLLATLYKISFHDASKKSIKHKNKCAIVLDRVIAIQKAIALADTQDWILIAGKGHENYQEIKGVKHHFDDKEILKEIFK